MPGWCGMPPGGSSTRIPRSGCRNRQPGFALGFQYYPYPFVRDGSLENSLLVLPRTPKPSDLTAAMNLAVDLGKRTRSDTTWLEALPADALTDQQRRSKHLIVVGLPTEHALIQQVNDRLPMPFSADGASLRQGNQTLVAVRNGGPFGVDQLLPSPFSEGQADRTAMVVVSGTAPEAVDWARAALGSSRLTGNVAIVSRDLRAQSFDVSPPTAGPVALATPRATIPLIATVVIALIVVLLVVLIIVQLLRERRRRSEAGLYPPATAT